MGFSKAFVGTANGFVLLFLVSCSSLEERLCNQNKAFQKGYDDVINGRMGSPGLQEGEACKKSEKYAYADFHRDYMTGFKKAKAAHCTSQNATKLGQNDAASNKAFKNSLAKLAVCLEDNSVTVNLENLYEIGYRKEFCQNARVITAAHMDAENFGAPKKTEDDYALCAYQKANLFKTYLSAHQDAIKAQCTPARAAVLATTLARAQKNISEGLVMLENCPKKLNANLSSLYTTAFQSERSNMMEEERLRMEQERLNREEANRQEMLRIKRRQVELEEQRLNKPVQQL